MPELPEVEVVRRSLEKRLKNKTIREIKIFYPKMFVLPSVEEVKNNIKNQTIIEINRKGKWLIFELNDYYLLSHLRMEGKYLFRTTKDPYEKHELVSFVFDDMELRYKDTRKFGRMYLMEKDGFLLREPLSKLGLEPWDNELNFEYLKDKFKTKNLKKKSVLLDQTIITGIGNIYADEILFLSKINPHTKSKELNKNQIEEIIKSTKKILEQAILDGGTTIRTYTSEEGVTGKFQNNLMVHQRENEPCKICNKLITKETINGRGSYFCTNCQK